ncbi:MAG: hypothetical protein H6705_13070 [Myxococcales bacterium]|nr:hypothetical protein [Myxococcales bacterium]
MMLFRGLMAVMVLAVGGFDGCWGVREPQCLTNADCPPGSCCHAYWCVAADDGCVSARTRWCARGG